MPALQTICLGDRLSQAVGEAAHQGLLDGVVAMDGGRQAGPQLLQRRLVLRQLLDVLQVTCIPWGRLLETDCSFSL